MTPANATLGGAVAGVSELQKYIDTYPCQANKNGTCKPGPNLGALYLRWGCGPHLDQSLCLADYFYFEPFDEPVRAWPTDSGAPWVG